MSTISPTQWLRPWRWCSPAHESGTRDTVEIAGLLPDDQRLFTPSAQVTPMTCKKAVFACLDTFSSTYVSPWPRLDLRLRRDVGKASWHGQSRQRKRHQTESADCPHVRRYLKPIVTPLPPILNEFSLPAKCELMIRSLISRSCAIFLLAPQPDRARVTMMYAHAGKLT